FGMQFSSFMIFLQDGSVSIYPNDFYIWIFFFKKHSTTGDGASRSCAYNEMSESSVRLFPDFRSSFLIMSLSVRKVVILVYVPCVFGFFCQSARNGIIRSRIIRSHIGRANNYFCSQSFQDISFLFRLLGIGNKDTAIAFYNRSQCKAHSSIRSEEHTSELQSRENL